MNHENNTRQQNLNRIAHYFANGLITTSAMNTVTRL